MAENRVDIAGNVSVAPDPVNGRSRGSEPDSRLCRAEAPVRVRIVAVRGLGGYRAARIASALLTSKAIGFST